MDFLFISTEKITSIENLSKEGWREDAVKVGQWEERIAMEGWEAKRNELCENPEENVYFDANRRTDKIYKIKHTPYSTYNNENQYLI